jgi:hypothetical protein
LVDTAALRRDLYLLLAFALASKSFAEQSADIDYDSLQRLRDDHEFTEVSGLLMSTAVRLRVLEDRGEVPAQGMQRHCGTLTSRQVTKPLTVREACNKIIHARKVQLRISHRDAEDAALPSPTTEYMEPFILLHGTLGRTTWRAFLDLVKFVRAVLALRAVYLP